jgi:hypothetical protein
LAALLLLLAPARAQTAGYPGTTSAPSVANTEETRREGPLGPGDSVTLEDCGFQPGSTVQVSFNGAPAGTATADANGCAHGPVKVLGSVQDCGPIEVNNVAFRANRGENRVVLVGTGSNGQARTFTNVLTVTCSGAAAAPFGRTGSNLGGWIRIGLALIVVGVIAVLMERRRLIRRVRR